MTIPGTSRGEAERLAAVRRYKVLDSPPDGAFDRVTALAARLFDVPISIVSIVDTDRIWFKSHHGLDVEEVDREPGLCASAILHEGPWVVNDARVDPRALANSLVAGEMGLRFYAGVPLTTSDGFNLGTLCVIDQQPRELSDDEVATLSDLAAVVVDELELRLAARRTVGLEAELRRSAEQVAASLQQSLLPLEVPQVPGLRVDARYHVANREQVGGDFYDVVPDRHGNGCAVVVGDVVGKGVRAAALTGTARWALRTALLDARTPASALTRLNDVLTGAHAVPDRYCTVALAAVRPDPKGGAALTVALGGHPAPLLLRRGAPPERVGTTSPVVGWKPDVEYVDATVAMAPGDVLVVFTDGMLEVVSGRGSVDDAALALLLGPLAGRTAHEVADALDRALGADDLTDDAAFVVVECR